MRLLSRHTLLQAVHITKGYGRKGDSLYYLAFCLITDNLRGAVLGIKALRAHEERFKNCFILAMKSYCEDGSSTVFRK